MQTFLAFKKLKNHMPPSREFYAGLIIGILGSFLGSLAASFLQAYFASPSLPNIILVSVSFVGLFAAVGLLYQRIMEIPE